MEAVPRLPMISFQLKVSTEKTSFSQSLKQYIAQFYGEDPESYNNEIHNLESLRGGAVRPTLDIEGIQLLKRYYCQLHFLKSRFPMEELQAAAVYFSWQDTYSTMACTIPDIRFEIMCILYNIGALHTQLGADDQRVTPDGMKIACTHFQCAAWAFQVLRENYYQMITYTSAVEVVHFMELVCLAQAQECILEKSMMDNRKASIIAKVAVQVVEYYRKAQMMLQGGVDESNYSDYVQITVFKEWVKYLNFKVAYHKCITLLYQGQQAEELQKMGERVALYQAAVEQLEEARKLSLGLDKKQEIAETLAFTSDFVEGKKKAAKNENDFIYHEEIPNKDSFPEVKGASLVKGIPFNISDIEVSGPDLFARLIPMEAHEASSLYSERKAGVLRNYGEMIEDKDQKLAEFMSSLQIDFLNDLRQATGIPQEIVDRAAALSARPNAIQDLTGSMTKLSNTFHEVDSLLNEIDALLKEEDESEREYQRSVGERPPSIIATDLSREAAKYKEAHNKANESNQNLHRAMVAHVGNLKMLSQPLNQLILTIPSIKMPDPNIDETALKEIEMLLSKVEEMKTQRNVLWAQLRDALHNDDITRVLVTKEANQNIDDIFKKELEKHQNLTMLIEQNTAAQDNIIKAFIDAYAKFSNTRRYLQGIITRRQSTINSLISSYESYEDLLSKANKGIEFYNKLETNINKLLQRIKSSCKVQQEEREQVLSKIKPSVPTESNSSESSGPKLKDYLDSMKKKNVPKTSATQGYTDGSFIGNIPNANETQIWPPGVRPTPLGSELNEQSNIVYDSTYRFSSNTRYGEEQNLMYFSVDGKLDISKVPEVHAPTRMSNQLPGGSHNMQALEKGLSAVTLNNEDAAYLSYQKYDKTVDTYYNCDNASLNKAYMYVPPGSTNMAMFNQPNTSNFYFQPAPGGINQITGEVQHSTSTFSECNPADVRLAQPTFNQMSGNFLQSHSSNPLVVQTDENPYRGIISSDAKAKFPSNSVTPVTYGNNFSPYIPTHYQQINQFPPESPNIQNGQNSSNNFYASGYAISQNSQSSGLATVQSNIYYNTDSTSQSDQTKGMQINAQNTPITQIQTDPYYCYGGYGNFNGINNYSVDSTGQIQNSASPYNLVNPISEFNATSSNQSQYSEGYVGAGSLIAPNQYNPSYMYTQAGRNYSYNPNQTSLGDNSGLMHQPSSNSDTNNGHCISSVSQSNSNISVPSKVSSTMDLLSGLDFSISQLPLEPEQKIINQTKPSVPASSSIPAKSVSSETEICSETDKSHSPDTKSKVKPSKPLDNETVRKLFSVEIDKYEKFVNGLNDKTLNGSTNLDLKWNEIKDSQDSDGVQKIISVARCYPMKNRFSDILPYDHSRVVLKSTKDDYINASYIKDISTFLPTIIVTQAPLQNTVVDFWTMIVEQNIKFVMCIVTANEMSGESYWPEDKGKDLYIGNMVLCLQNIRTAEYWIERSISINFPERKQSTTVVHMQFTDWSESVLPTSPFPFISFVKQFVILHQQEKIFSNPILIHCLSGIGRSGVACLLMYALLEATNNTIMPDLTYLANKVSTHRKNILRDREHLKFFYFAFLAYMKQMVSDEGNILDSDQMERKKGVEIPSKDDPLNSLDPFWASKRDQNSFY